MSLGSEPPRETKVLRFGPRWPQRRAKPLRRRPPLNRDARLAWYQLAAIVALFVTVGVGVALQTPYAARTVAFLLTGHEAISGRVNKVIDGDGIVVGRTEIRLGDFDAPEWNEPGGQTATAALRSIAAGREVVCTACEGARRPGQCTSYDRVIATCRLDGARLGDLMRQRGIREGGR
ncbi:MAG: hypothetical protein EXQ88_03790 [Alphaproteobacteria bacterium]|nr:hypothetical protein [Alphaproteobacteria bacterium]